MATRVDKQKKPTFIPADRCQEAAISGFPTNGDRNNTAKDQAKCVPTSTKYPNILPAVSPQPVKRMAFVLPQRDQPCTKHGGGARQTDLRHEIVHLFPVIDAIKSPVIRAIALIFVRPW